MESALIRDLAAGVGSDKLVVDPDVLAGYRGVAWSIPSPSLPLSRPPGQPAVAVLPARVEDVVAVVECARKAGTPIVPYGAGTGVHAGAAPLESCILLDLGAMHRVLAIAREDRMATVEPGVVLAALDGEAAAHGLMVGHDPWSQPIASVGGAVSTNGVGYLAGKYGSMGEQVLGLEVVLGSGEIVRTSHVPKSSTGPALRHFFIGGEGVFGIITRVDVRLFPVPERRTLQGYLFPRFEDGLAAAMEMQAVQLRPSMIDYGEDETVRKGLRPGELVDVPSEMYLAFEGFSEEVDAQVHRADQICQRLAGEPLPAEEVQEFWDTRHQSADRYLQRRQEGQPWPMFSRSTGAHLNIGLPASAVQEFRHRAARALMPYRLVLRESGIWGMPELFSVRFEHQVPGDPDAPGEVEAGTDVGLRIAQELGGSMEYCHGVGLRLAHLMASELGAGLEVLRRIKRALDPDGILNPGKLGL